MNQCGIWPVTLSDFQRWCFLVVAVCVIKSMPVTSMFGKNLNPMDYRRDSHG